MRAKNATICHIPLRVMLRLAMSFFQGRQVGWNAAKSPGESTLFPLPGFSEESVRVSIFYLGNFTRRHGGVATRTRPIACRR